MSSYKNKFQTFKCSYYSLYYRIIIVLSVYHVPTKLLILDTLCVVYLRLIMIRKFMKRFQLISD